MSKPRKSKPATKREGRDRKGQFVPGALPPCGVRFGEGQPTDRGGRPPVTMRMLARQIGDEVVDKADKRLVRELVLRALVKRAFGGDVRAAEVFCKLHDGDDDSGGKPTRFLFTTDNLENV